MDLYHVWHYCPERGFRCHTSMPRTFEEATCEVRWLSDPRTVLMGTGERMVPAIITKAPSPC